jgi:hypothetical protein
MIMNYILNAKTKAENKHMVPSQVKYIQIDKYILRFLTLTLLI